MDVEVSISGFNRNTDEERSEIAVENFENHVKNELSPNASTNATHFDNDPIKRNETGLNNLENDLQTLCVAAEHKTVPANEKHNTNQAKLDRSHVDSNDSSDTDACSIGNLSTSTIAPSVIHSKVKKNFEKQRKTNMRKKCIAKGEASAVIRKRRDNKITIKEYTSSIWR